MAYNNRSTKSKDNTKPFLIAGLVILVLLIIAFILLVFRSCAVMDSPDPDNPNNLIFDDGAVVGGWDEADIDAIISGLNDKVEEGLRKILPDDHKYYETCGEPYAMFNSYLGKETGYRAGKPGQSWRTASGQWLLYSLVRFIYGLQPEFDGLLLRPCLPTSWKDCHITKNFRDCEYRIHYQQTEDGGCNRIGKLTVNGKEADPTLPIRPVAGAVLDIEVTLVK